MGNIQFCSLTLWNSFSPSSALPQEKKMSATDVDKKAWCSSNLWYLNSVCHLAHAHGSRERAVWYFTISIPTSVSADSTEHQSSCSSSSTSVLHLSHTQSKPTQSYLLLMPFEPLVNSQSSQFIPLYHPSGSSILALRLISFIVSVIFFSPSRKSIPCCTGINTDWPVCR